MISDQIDQQEVSDIAVELLDIFEAHGSTPGVAMAALSLTMAAAVCGHELWDRIDQNAFWKHFRKSVEAEARRYQAWTAMGNPETSAVN
jgi:hypothetical protein